MNQVALYTLTTREVKRFVRLWRQTLIPPMITALLYLIVFGSVIGQRVGQVQGVDYIVFVLPGLAMLTMVLASFQNSVSSFYIEKYNQSLDELLVAPMSHFDIILGFIFGGILRGLLTGFLIVLLGKLFLHITIMHIGYMIVAMALVCFTFACLGMLNAMYAKKFDDITTIPDFILTPLIFFGGVFYDGSNLKGPMLWLHTVNPISYYIDLFRYSLLGTGEFDHYIVLAFTVCMAAISFTVLYVLFNRGYGVKY